MEWNADTYLAVMAQVYGTESDEYKQAEKDVKSGRDSTSWYLYNDAHQYWLGITGQISPQAETISPYQEAQLGFQKEQFEWQKRQTALSQAQDYLDKLYEQQRQGRQVTGEERAAIYDQLRRQMSEEFESWRTLTLANLGTNDWISAWQLENVKNPYKKKRSDLFQEYQEHKLERVQPPEWARVTGGLEYGQGAPSGVSQVSPYSAEFQERMAWLGEKEKKAQTKEQAQAKALRAGVPAPAWLPQFALGQTAGQGINLAKNKALATPSGQLWATASPATQAKLAAYAKWSGQDLGDILWQMERMQPTTPKSTYYKKWIPARAV